MDILEKRGSAVSYLLFYKQLCPFLRKQRKGQSVLVRKSVDDNEFCGGLRSVRRLIAQEIQARLPIYGVDGRLIIR